MPVDEVPDSTDWLATPLPGLAVVEAALRCQVCKDFYKTPMITSCSHTFCSLCIRRALSNDGKCPLCRAPEQELKLRSNWSVEEAVQAFSRARPHALALARDARSASPSGKRKAEVCEPPETNPKRLRTSARLSKTRAGAAITSSAAEAHEEAMESPEDEEYVPDDPDGTVPCPVCQRRMKAWQVFQHLETCPGPSAQRGGRSIDSPVSSSYQAQQRQLRSHERLPALNYSMLKEQALRKKMTELGLSGQGPRLLLERRHKEWLTLWNANCDAAQPKKRSDLLHDLEVWERTQGGRAPTTGRTFQTAAAIKDKDFDSAAWAVKHDTSFKDLIASARKSKTDAKTRAENTDERPALDGQPDTSAIIADSRDASPSSPPKDDTSMRNDGRPGETTQPLPRPDMTRAAALGGATKTMPTVLAGTMPSPYPDDARPGAQDAAG
ncbi:zinc finger, c3HC4 type (RING finger) domain-containing protein [Hirsutella rhossiliensis]|uniref:Postreplication repair E3 ubiquitin-protein ligase RAD18 n=1 Tax=Hirsutella rhossiliensis TaxID=111463 RepID=A0A9P8MTT4_9HYPO|nr:zinc finger, c3HC4 type (RING finger) domain-containing protein [Hirsutella rhossiliensis]KAH0960299.1 zinc finger, c3HC4 type (RING finger) domain-containing protein [Hirsutella rhossiliensis]